MGSPYSTQLHNTVSWLLSLIASGTYEELEAMYVAAKPDSRYIEQALMNYRPVHYTMPPDNELANLIYYIEAVRSPTQVPSWRVAIDLWTVEEGRSDLTLQVTIMDTGQALYDVLIDDLHVL